MKIIAYGECYKDVVAQQLPMLKPEVKAATGQSFRRISRFIQFSLIAVARCVAGRSLPKNTALYLTSGQGDLTVAIDVLEKLYQQGEPPMPLGFINTLSNSACFYVAQYLGLQGSSNFVSSQYFSFERILRLALLDYNNKKVQSALVGSVDVCVAPLSQHRERMAVEADIELGEASHYLLLGDVASNERVEPHLGELLKVEHCIDWQELLFKLNALEVNEAWYLAAGQFLSAAALEQLQAATGISEQFEYRNQLAFYNTQMAAVFGKFFSACPGKTLLHVNGDKDGRYCFFVIKAT